MMRSILLSILALGLAGAASAQSRFPMRGMSPRGSGINRSGVWNPLRPVQKPIGPAAPRGGKKSSGTKPGRVHPDGAKPASART